MSEDRFDLEQKILKVWGIIDDIAVMTENKCAEDDYKALARVYEVHLQSLWNLFEKMISEGNIK